MKSCRAVDHAIECLKIKEMTGQTQTDWGHIQQSGVTSRREIEKRHVPL